MLIQGSQKEGVGLADGNPGLEARWGRGASPSRPSLSGPSHTQEGRGPRPDSSGQERASCWGDPPGRKVAGRLVGCRAPVTPTVSRPRDPRCLHAPCPGLPQLGLSWRGSAARCHVCPPPGPRRHPRTRPGPAARAPPRLTPPLARRERRRLHGAESGGESAAPPHPAGGRCFKDGDAEAGQGLRPFLLRPPHRPPRSAPLRPGPLPRAAPPRAGPGSRTPPLCAPREGSEPRGRPRRAPKQVRAPVRYRPPEVRRSRTETRTTTIVETQELDAQELVHTE